MDCSRLLGGLLLSCGLALIAGCGSDDTSDAGGSGAAGSVASSGAQGGSGGSGGGSGGMAAAGGGGAGGALRACHRKCSAPADCFDDGANPPFDLDNWACKEGLCQWLGCLNDAECDFFGGVCRLGSVSNDDVKTCTEACTDSAVCTEALASVDDDNWSCPDGGCKYLGCKSDGECVTDYGAGSKCVTPAKGFAQCAKGCSAPADCVADMAPRNFDADNWKCEGGLCVYAGCADDDECTTVEGKPAVCN